MRAIDGDALIDWIDPGHLRHPSELCFSESDVVNMINHAPTIEPERKKGKWIRWYETKENETGTIYIPHCKCSECNTEHNPVRSKSVSFCDVCGAEMRIDE